MPELPEVETIRRQLEPLVRGRHIVAAGGHPSASFHEAVEATGAGIDGVARRGKYLLLRLDDDRELVIHLGMTGRLSVRTSRHDAAAEPPHLRAWWRLDDGVLELHDVRRFGRVAVVPAGRHDRLPTLAALGPEPFSPEFTPDHLWQAVRASRARIKTQLLSQRPVAGVGNIYADEALWLAGIHPASRRLARAGAARLHEALVTVLRAGIDNGGTTLRDYRNVDGRPGSNQYQLHCYGRAGEPCDRCATVLARSVIDARGTTWCRRCQPR